MDATEPYQVDELSRKLEQAEPFGEKLVWFDRDQTKSLVDSPLFLRGLFNPHGVAMVNQTQLAWDYAKPV